MFMYDINQRLHHMRGKDPRWRISFTSLEPAMINYNNLISLGLSFGLEIIETNTLLYSGDFPPQLLQPGREPRHPYQAQWPYRAAVAALAAAGARKRAG